MLRKVQYVGREHTMIRNKTGEKIRVDEKEVIEVEVEREIDLKYYTLNGFKVVDNDTKIKAKKEEPKAEEAVEEEAEEVSEPKAEEVVEEDVEEVAEPKAEEAVEEDVAPEADDIEALKLEAAELGITVKGTRGIKAIKKAIEESKAV